MRLPGIGNSKQAVLLACLAVVLVLAVVRWRPGGAPPPPAATASRGRSAAAALGEDAASGTARSAGRGRAHETSPEEVPILAPEDFNPPSRKQIVETGRDLFDAPREPTRRPPPTPYPPPPPPGDARYIGPMPPPPPTPTPRAPEISFRFVGTFGPKAHPIAVIQQGDRVYNVRAGDILFDKFVLRSVGYESIEVGFVGYPQTADTRVGITSNTPTP